MNEITASKLRSLIAYQPSTGQFIAQIQFGRHIAAGFEIPSSGSKGYRLINISGHSYKAHRLAWLLMTGAWPQGDIDHVNGNRADNRWKNLRDVTRSVNLQNLRRARTDSCTGLPGVSPSGRRWMARIKTDGRQKYLGCFATPEAASAAYLAAKRELHPGCTV